MNKKETATTTNLTDKNLEMKVFKLQTEKKLDVFSLVLSPFEAIGIFSPCTLISKIFLNSHPNICLFFVFTD